MFDKRYQVDRTSFKVKKFSIHVEAASRIILTFEIWISILFIMSYLRKTLGKKIPSYDKSYDI